MYKYSNDAINIETDDRILFITLLNAAGVDVSSEMYVSSTTREITPYTEMNINYLKNALFKLYIQWIEQIRKEETNKAVRLLLEGPKDPTLIKLAEEFERRNRL